MKKIITTTLAIALIAAPTIAEAKKSHHAPRALSPEIQLLAGFDAILDVNL